MLSARTIAETLVAGLVTLGIWYIAAKAGVAGQALVLFLPLPLLTLGFLRGAVVAFILAVIFVSILAGLFSLQDAFVYTAMVVVPAFLILGCVGKAWWMGGMANAPMQIRPVPIGTVLTVLAFVLVVVVVALMFIGGTDPNAALYSEFKANWQALMEQARKAGQADVVHQMELAFPQLFKTLFGLTGIWLQLYSIYNAVLGYRIARKMSGSIQPSLSMASIHLPGWVSIVACMVIIAAFLLHEPFSTIGFNVLAILMVPLFFEGLAVVHAFAASWSHKRWILTGFYIMMAVLPWLIPVIAGLAIIDEGLDVRKHFSINGRRVERK